MSRGTVVIISAVTIVALAVTGGGAWVLRAHTQAQQRKLVAAANAAKNSSSGALQPLDGQNIPLGAQSTQASTNGLSVGSASGLGQLGAGATSTTSTSTSAGSASSDVLPRIDTSAFAQYDKYKNNKDALFGEVQAGTGVELTPNHKAAIYYKGWLTDGRLFGESGKGNDGKPQPYIFTLGSHEVIPGLEEGVAGMKQGGTRIIIVPPALGYGAAGHDPVPANAVTVFEVYLVVVQ
jgi:FKBP-type peptidyl-prolyl cis-trans isomerase FkpA